MRVKNNLHLLSCIALISNNATTNTKALRLISIIAAVYLILFNYSFAQNIYCDHEDVIPGQQNSLPTACFNYNNYITDDTHLNYTPIIYVNVNLHFISLDNGTQSDYTNFTTDGADNPAGYTAYQYAQDLIYNCNSLLANNPLLTGTFATGIQPQSIQIRLKLYSPNGDETDAVHCWSTQNQNYFYYAPTTGHQSLLKGTFSVYNDDVIDVFFVRDLIHPNDLGGYGPPTTNAISITNAYNLYLNNVGAYVVKHIVLHELGHVFSLQHSWFSTNNCGPFAQSNAWGSSGSNNVMAYNYQANWENCQIGLARMDLITKLPKYINRNHLCTYNPDATINIASGENILWNSTRYLQGDVIVKSGGTLTITCKVGMAKGARFVVESNAKLIIDGGWITNVCEESWYGIEVLGKFNRPQYMLSNGYRNQGYLEIKNGAIIEYAQNTIALWDSYHNNLYKTGGIVRASDSYFINNRRSVEFMKYQNIDTSGNPKPNLSYFKNCSFTITNELPKDMDFFAHVTMWNVDGIKFTACKFKNEKNGYTQQHQLGYGIYSIDAGYTVQGLCTGMVQAYQPCPVNDIEYSEFENLYMGINASNAASANFFTIDMCKFNKNFRSIQASSVNRFVAINSKFTMGNNPLNGNSEPGNAHQLGIYAIKCSGYSIENNLFERSTGTAYGLTDGVIIYQSGGAPNQVYRNTLSRLNNIGLMGVGNNYNVSTPTIGFQSLCNTFTNQVQQDMASTHINPLDFSTVPNSGISGGQGSTQQPAGNCFNAPANNAVGHFSRSSQTNNLSYYYDNSNPCKEPIQISNGIQKILVSPINPCPIKRPQFYTPLFSPSGLNNEKLKYNNSLNEFTTTKQAYLLLIDGGQSTQLRDEVFNAVPSQAWHLYNELNQYSPNLSLEVALKAIAREDVLSNSMIFDLLYNNPDLLRDEHIFRALDERTTPMPQYMVITLRSRADVRTLRSLLAEQMSLHFSGALESLNNIVIHYLSDSTNTIETDSLITHFMLEGKHTLYVNDALRYNLQRGNLNDASSILGMLDDNEWINETPEQTSSSMDYYTTLLLWQQDSVSLAGLDTAQILGLEQLAEHHNDYAGIEAINILNFFYGYNYYFDVPETDFEEAGERRSEILNTINTLYRFAAAPNPAADYSTVTWLPFGATASNATLRVFNPAGVEVLNTAVNAKTGQYLLKTAALENGIYLIQLQTAERLLQTKLYVQH